MQLQCKLKVIEPLHVRIGPFNARVCMYTCLSCDLMPWYQALHFTNGGCKNIVLGYWPYTLHVNVPGQIQNLQYLFQTIMVYRVINDSNHV